MTGLAMQLEFGVITAAERKKRREVIQRQLLPTVLSRGAKCAEGFTWDDVRAWGETARIVTGLEPAQRALSWGGPWLRDLARRGLIENRLDPNNRPIQRASKRKAAHGNLQDVYQVPPPHAAEA